MDTIFCPWNIHQIPYPHFDAYLLRMLAETVADLCEYIRVCFFISANVNAGHPLQHNTKKIH